MKLEQQRTKVLVDFVKNMLFSSQEQFHPIFVNLCKKRDSNRSPAMSWWPESLSRIRARPNPYFEGKPRCCCRPFHRHRNSCTFYSRSRGDTERQQEGRVTQEQEVIRRRRRCRWLGPDATKLMPGNGRVDLCKHHCRSDEVGNHPEKLSGHSSIICWFYKDQ